jgi:hypothetical protein
MMSRDGALTAQPARPEEPARRLLGESQRRPRPIGRNSHPAARATFIHPGRRAARCCGRSGDDIPQNAVDDRLPVRDWNHVPCTGRHALIASTRGGPNWLGMASGSADQRVGVFLARYSEHENQAPSGLHRPNVKRVPTLVVTSWSGIRRRMVSIKSAPEQCIGMTTSGLSASSSVTVRSI